jgi:hypothetical protein
LDPWEKNPNGEISNPRKNGFKEIKFLIVPAAGNKRERMIRLKALYAIEN